MSYLEDVANKKLAAKQRKDDLVQEKILATLEEMLKELKKGSK